MTLAHAAILAALAVDLGYGFLVYLTNARRAVNQHFLTLTLVLGGWLACVLFALLSTAEISARFWISQAFVLGGFIPVGFDLIRVAILHPHESWRQAVGRTGWIVAGSFAIGILCQTPALISRVDLASASPSEWAVANPTYGWGFAVWNVCFIVYAIVLTICFVRDVRRLRGMQQVEMQFVLLACITSFLTALTLVVFVPVLTGSSWSAPLAPMGVIVFNAIMAYGIATRRIMGVDVILRRATAYVLLAGYLGVLYYCTLFVVDAMLRAFALAPGEWPHLLGALVVAFSLAPAHGRMQRIATRLFVREDPLDLSRLIQRAGRALQSIATLDELLRIFSELVTQSMGTDRVVLLLTDGDRLGQVYAAPPAAPFPALAKTHPLAALLRQTEEPLVAEIVLRRRPQPFLTDAAHALQQLGFSAAVGIHFKGALSGAMLLGPRLSGRIYGVSEQDALRVLCGQLAVALDNSKLYTEVQNRRIYNDILVDSLLSGVVAADNERRITVFNREARRITRLDAETRIGQPIDLLPEALRGVMETTYAAGRGAEDHDVSIRLPGAEEEDEIFVRVGSAVFHGHTGERLGVLMVFHDMTAMRRLQEQVRRTDRLASMGTLAAGMAHEIKNPLVTIKTFTQLLQERYADPEFRDTFVPLVSDEVKRIDGIVNQLLSFARPSKPRMVNMHVHEVLDKSLRLVQQEFIRKNILVSRDCAAERDLMHGDPDLLSQAFINFFLNSVDAMDGGGQLRISTRATLTRRAISQGTSPAAPPRYIRIEIVDTGEGIKESDLTRIFDPFFTTKSQGTGLGLTVSHGIIYEQRGSIDVESHLEQGTTFRIVFPLIGEPAPTEGKT